MADAQFLQPAQPRHQFTRAVLATVVDPDRANHWVPKQDLSRPPRMRQRASSQDPESLGVAEVGDAIKTTMGIRVHGAWKANSVPPSLLQQAVGCVRTCIRHGINVTGQLTPRMGGFTLLLDRAAVQVDGAPACSNPDSTPGSSCLATTQPRPPSAGPRRPGACRPGP
jgi:hypothetical protein